MKKIFTKAALTSATAIIIYLMALNFILHMVVPSRQYGLFFDEYYYYSMSNHLAFGYMDAPPITGWLMALSRLLMGDSVSAMHVFPALAGSFTMFFAALTARKMGGGRFSQALTATVVMLAPVFMTFIGMFTYDAFDQMMSAMVIFMVAIIIKGEATPRTWILFGFIAGIGLMVKITMGFLLICLVIGILLTRARKYLASKWFWISIAIALACFLPFIIWQAMHGFPVYEYLLAYRGARSVNPSILELLRYVFVTMNPASVLLWLGGLALLFTKRGRIFRPFAWAFLAYFTLAVILGVKFYALAGALLPLVAFGSVCLEKNYRNVPFPQKDCPLPQKDFPLPQKDFPLPQNDSPVQKNDSSVQKNDSSVPPLPPKKKRKVAWTLKVSYIVVLALLGAAFTPLSFPVLSPYETAVYNNTVGYSESVTWDTVVYSGLPTYFAGRLGWDELAQSISEVYHSLPEADQKDCSIYCFRYGAVGAMDYYGKKYGLPPAISANLGAYYWGYGKMDGNCVIFVKMGSNQYSMLEDYFKDVKIVLGSPGVFFSTLYYSDRSIYICRGLKVPADEFWKAMQSKT